MCLLCVSLHSCHWKPPHNNFLTYVTLRNIWVIVSRSATVNPGPSPHTLRGEVRDYSLTTNIIKRHFEIKIKFNYWRMCGNTVEWSILIIIIIVICYDVLPPSRMGSNVKSHSTIVNPLTHILGTCSLISVVPAVLQFTAINHVRYPTPYQVLRIPPENTNEHKSRAMSPRCNQLSTYSQGLSTPSCLSRIDV